MAPFARSLAHSLLFVAAGAELASDTVGSLRGGAVERALGAATPEAVAAAPSPAPAGEAGVVRLEPMAAGTAGCQDTDWQCVPWAARGECEANPAYMLANCPRACNNCPTEPPAEATEPPTQPPTEPPTEPPTDAPMPAPTQPPTAPTQPPTRPPTQPPTPPPTQPPTPPPTQPPAVEVPGTEECKSHGFTIDRCYFRFGFVDGDCICTPGLWEGRYAWYQWVCTKKHGARYTPHFCDQHCTTCHP